MKKEKKIKTSELTALLRNTKLLEQAIWITKIRKAVLKMMKEVSLDNKPHTYIRNIDGVWMQGISTVSSIVPKPWLSAWGAKESVKFMGYSDYKEDTATAEKMLKKIKKCKTVEEYQAILKEAKGASFRKSKESLVDGTAGHLWLESFVKAKIRGTEQPIIPNGKLERPIKQFIEWEAKDVDYWIISEAMVAYPIKKFAGTLDALAMMKTGRLALIDFKFASRISEDYFLQTAGYKSCFEPHKIDIQDRIIVRLPKTTEREEWDSKTRKYSKVANNIEVMIVETDYETDRDVFLSCLPVKKWINTIN